MKLALPALLFFAFPTAAWAADPQAQAVSTSPEVASPETALDHGVLSLDREGRPTRGVGVNTQQLSWEDFYLRLDPDFASDYRSRRGLIDRLRSSGAGLIILGGFIWWGSRVAGTESTPRNTRADAASYAAMGLGAASLGTSFLVPDARPDRAVLARAIGEYNEQLLRFAPLRPATGTTTPLEQSASSPPDVVLSEISREHGILSLDQERRPTRGVGTYTRQLSWEDFYLRLDPKFATEYRNRRDLIGGLRGIGIGLVAFGGLLWWSNGAAGSAQTFSRDPVGVSIQYGSVGFGATSFVMSFLLPEAHPDRDVLEKAMEKHNQRLLPPTLPRPEAPEVKLEWLTAVPLPGGAALTAALSF